MADYEPGHYRSGFEDDERRAPYATDFGGRGESRYATGYGYGPTYGGTAGSYGSTYGGGSPGAFGGTTGGYGHGATTHTTAGTFGRTTSHTETGYGTTGRQGGLASEAGYGTSRFGASRVGRHEGTTFGTRSWRDEGIGERRYPTYGQTTSGWTHQEESRYGEPGRTGIGRSITGLQEFGAYGPNTPFERRRIGSRQYGPY